MRNQKLDELIYLREEEMMNVEYSMNRTYLMKKYWNRFKNYCNENNIYYFDYDVAKEYINSNYKDDKKKLNEATRAMLILNDFESFKKISKYPIDKILSKKQYLNDYYNDLLNKYLNYSREIRLNGRTTLSLKENRTRDFFLYLEENSIMNLNDFTKNDFYKYITMVLDMKHNQKEEIYYNLRTLFGYLNSEKLYQNNYIYLVPVLNRRRKGLPSVFEKEDKAAILSQFKENVNKTSAGYRNYAMLLLISTYGIRNIDVKNLKWKNINWDTNTIEIIQQKTKVKVTLPLTNDIGEAIINYIKKERPHLINNNEEYIFIRHRFPYEKLAYGSNLNDTISRIAKECNVNLDKYRKKGTHNFRYTLATELLNNEIPVNIISSILGHSDINSTKTYLKIDEKHLKDCFVEVNYE